MKRSLGRLRRLPLHLHIATIFTFLIILVGGVVGWFNYHQSTRVILAASTRVFDQISRELLLDFQTAYRPVVSTVNLLSLEDQVSGARSLDERLGLLPEFREVLAEQPHVSALQVGYADGDFFIVRPLNSAYMRQRFEAPEEAVWVADNITENEAGERVQTRLFFDGDLNRLAERALGATSYDPRVRPWYKVAAGKSRAVATNPYLYYFIKQVGITVGRQSADGHAVVASDITLQHLSETLAGQQISPSAEAVLFDTRGRAIAYRDAQRLVLKSDTSEAELAKVDGLGSPVLAALAPRLTPEDAALSFSFEGREWRGAVRRVEVTDDIVFFVAITAPEDELLAEAILIRKQSIWVTGFILLMASPLAWLLANQIARPLRRLTRETDRIRHFDFAGPVTTDSTILEIHRLAESISAMKSTIRKFLELVSSVASERHFDQLLAQIAEQAMGLSGADAAVLYLVNEEGTALEPACVRTEAGPSREEDMPGLPRVALDGDGPRGPLAESVRTGQTVTSTTERTARVEEGEGAGPLASLLDTEMAHLVAIPLRARDGHVAGTLGLAFDTAPSRGERSVEQERIAFIEAFSGFAVVSLESQQLLKMQRALLDAFIKLMAGAIDAKSPYTGGHCQRVPVLTQLIAQAACDDDTAPFRGFDLDEEGWEALHIASWLHDCGKVTTPEYVVDKATKLETIHNRLHEVRTRFEVLKRDATIAYWEAVAPGRDDVELRARLEAEHRQLDDDFAFVARCNEGRESISPEEIDRLQRIAERTWTRTFDDGLGLSVQEAQRRAERPPYPAPAAEPLLQDKPEHLIDSESPGGEADNPWGFKVDIPEHAYNRGELHNLCVSRGTLTPEERHKINDHIVQTIIMLSSLPWPKHLRDVPDIAGGHHERPDGTGYPRCLTSAELPIEARIMAVADIFEALTAPDRPYKRPKPLSEALDIMRAMAERNHIDADVFWLFVQSGACDAYAKEHLHPDQIDMAAEDYIAART